MLPLLARSSRDELMGHMRAFDAAKAECFKPSDKEHILSIIETAFGSVDEFTAAVRAAFATSRGLEKIDVIRRSTIAAESSASQSPLPPDGNAAAS